MTEAGLWSSASPIRTWNLIKCCEEVALRYQLVTCPWSAPVLFCSQRSPRPGDIWRSWYESWWREGTDLMNVVFPVEYWPTSRTEGGLEKSASSRGGLCKLWKRWVSSNGLRVFLYCWRSPSFTEVNKPFLEEFLLNCLRVPFLHEKSKNVFVLVAGLTSWWWSSVLIETWSGQDWSQHRPDRAAQFSHALQWTMLTRRK